MSRRLLRGRVNLLDIRDIADRLEELEAMEGTMYKMLSLANKTGLAEVLGIGKTTLMYRIKKRLLSISELTRMFKAMRDCKEEDYKKARLGKIRKMSPMSLEEFNKRHVYGIKGKRKDGKKDAGRDEGPLEMEGRDGPDGGE